MNRPIAAAQREERHRLRLEKKAIGRTARTLLLAYAFVRGVPRERLERQRIEGETPCARSILEIVVASCPSATLDELRRWLVSPGG
jgi:hypothetical protein